MKIIKYKKFFKIFIIIYVSYALITGLLIFKIPIVVKSDLLYDTSLMTTKSDSDTYAYLVEDIDEAMNVRLGLIEEATETINITYYKYLMDEAGQILSGALLTRADEGIKINIILDSRSYSKNKNLRSLISHENVTYKVYEPSSLLFIHHIQNTLHDKILTIDQKYGLIGGRNVTDRFLIDNDVNVLDRDVLIFSKEKECETVLQMNDYYEELFTSKYAKLYKRKNRVKYQETRDEMKEKYFEHRLNGYDFISAIETATKVERATFVRSPLNRMQKEPIMFNVVNQLMENSDNIIIQSPYITKSRLMKKYFPYDETKNITFITNNMQTNPNIPSLSGYIRIRKKLATLYNVYEIQTTDSIHAKTITIGDNISIIGSLNIDHRSMFLSTESSVVIYSEEFQEVLNVQLNELIEQSLLVNEDGTYEENNNVIEIEKNNFKKAVVRFTSWISWFFNEML